MGYFIEKIFRARIENIKEWLGDGVIADYDDPEIENLLLDVNCSNCRRGGSFHRPECYPPVLPSLYRQRRAGRERAFLHLKEKGINCFWLFTVAHIQAVSKGCRRSNVFGQLVAREKYSPRRGLSGPTAPENWHA